MRLPPAWRWLTAVSLTIPAVLLSQATAPSSRAAQPMTAAEVQKLAQNPSQRVIVILRDQHLDAAGAGRMSVRTAAIHADQAGIVRELQQVKAPRVEPFHLINAIATTVSQAEIQHLRANPQIQAVVSDAAVPRPKVKEVSGARSVAHTSAATSTSAVSAGGTLAQACSSTSQPLLEPEALQVTHTAGTTNSAQDLTTPAGKKINGAGVKVAFMADTVDPNNQDFIRPDGSPVFVDYQDFNGDGFFDRSGGAEAFGDASSIAAQGRFTYDASAYANPRASVTVHHPCPIRVLGMAPGASLMALKVFGNLPAFDADFVLAIQYAADHGANILNESFGGNPQPDLNNVDPISLADEAAIQDGVTVIASTGDAGTAGTMGSPSTDPDVISVGASTTLRLLEQTGYPGTGLGTGWVSDKLSTLSSAGVAQNGRQTVDVVAPGYLGWAVCSTNVTLFPECTSFTGAPSPILDFGGTSESAPLTAGEAALVFQAYRATHANHNPTPAQVKQIIQSTADNLDYPGYEQGAGLINSYKAVLAAMSVKDPNASPLGRGDQLLVRTHSEPNALDQPLVVEGNPGSSHVVPIQVTNAGAHAETVTPTVRRLTLGPTQQHLITLSPSISTPFTDALGRAAFKTNQTFTVPAGQQYLRVAEAYNTVGQPSANVRVSLYEPDGKIVHYSAAQGAGSGYLGMEVSDPQPGTWTAVLWVVAGQYAGPVHLDITTGTFTPAGTVQPASMSVQPGQTVTFQVTANLPSQPGDSTADVLLRSTAPGSSSENVVPIVARTLVPLGPRGGTWTGTITGGNGRPNTGPEQTFSFNVPSGLRDIDLGISTDGGYNLFAALLAPNGTPVDYQSNITGFDAHGNPTGYAPTLQFFQDNPVPGQWRLVFLLNYTSPGFTTAEPFTGIITFNNSGVSAAGVPTNPAAKQVAGKPVTATINVTNTGLVTEHYFVDPRLDTLTTYLTGSATDVPMPGGYTLFPVPPQTATVTALAQADVPFMLEEGNNVYTPPVGFGGGAAVVGGSFQVPNGPSVATVSYSSSPEVNPGDWYAVTTPVGPFGASGAPTGTASIIAGEVKTKTFDLTTTSSTGDFWAYITGVSPAPPRFLTLGPGQSGQITVTFTPTGAPGTIVRGALYVDTIGLSGGYLSTSSGDEVAAIPYRFTVASS